MITVNLAFAEYLFAAIWGLGDVDNTRPELIVHGDVPNKNEKIKNVFETFVVPYVRAWDAASLIQGKLALQYVLTFDPGQSERMFERALAPCDAPEPASLIFEWIWDAMFPGESWLLDRDDEYEVVDEPEEIKVIFNPDVKIPSPVIGQEHSDYQPKKAL